jgi:hypothetical protein
MVTKEKHNNFLFIYLLVKIFINNVLLTILFLTLTFITEDNM